MFRITGRDQCYNVLHFAVNLVALIKECCQLLNDGLTEHRGSKVSIVLLL